MKAYKTELAANNKQITAMRQHVGAARWAYNWGLAKVKQAADSKVKWPTAIDLHREINKLKGTDALPWGYSVSKCAFQEALRNLQAAVDNWDRSRKGKRKGPKVCFPKGKTRKRGLGSCRFTGTVKVFDGCIQLPRIGVVRLKEHGYIPTGKYAQATISEKAERWFVSVTIVDTQDRVDLETGEILAGTTGDAIGVDVGIKILATCSDGETFANPKALVAKIKRLRMWQRRLSRRVKGSKNRAKARKKVARLHKQVADVRRDAHNKVARSIVDKRPSVIVIEDLNVNGMFKNRRLARALSDAAFGQFGRILTHRAEDAGVTVVRAGRFFASSKTCSACGWRDEDLTLGDRVFECQGCGLSLDRDLNASLNLKHTVSSTGINACGDRVSPGLAQAVVVEAGTWHQMSLFETFV